MSDTQSEALPAKEQTASPSAEGRAPVAGLSVNMKRFLAEVRRRGVLKAATGYLIASWLTLHIGHTLFDIFELPHLGVQLIFALLAVGFPLLILAVWRGWFGTTALAQTDERVAKGGHESSPHDGPWMASIFAALALIAAAVAIGIRFVGTGASSSHLGKGEAATAPQIQSPATAPAPPSVAEFHPPARSIAVLPFVNMSGDPNEEYFSDGLAEELLNSLASIETLHVTARTSSFSFKGKTVDVATIAHQLNVGAILEGSVRRANNRIRITAQLIDPITGFHVWSQTYDRESKDVLELQSEIAQAITAALSGRLLGDSTAKLDLGSTDNPAAFDAYLRGIKIYNSVDSDSASIASLEAFDKAIALDPKFALAHTYRSVALRWRANYAVDSVSRLAILKQARAAAEAAITLAPNLGKAHTALGGQLLDQLDFKGASAEFERALALSQGTAGTLRHYSILATMLGHHTAALNSALRSVELDPLDFGSHQALVSALFYSRRYEEAISASKRLNDLVDPMFVRIAMSNLLLGRTAIALDECSREAREDLKAYCLAFAYGRLGQTTDSAAELAKYKSLRGEAAAYQYAQIYAQWGNGALAQKWLETAFRLQDPGLAFLQVDPLLDPLRETDAFRTLVHKMNFPK